ncbi:hypothetical protein [Limnoglobus roseus]|uniref:Uncharacterized protein n=1 Tax=Limnoglobus roseus TaxID=2598579 RepID=A0A5C1AFD9_9BACT|nr:hypothetical protein [Limnoglobus roseus]QEL17285.1 hypothetical protein PX52LOC_04268 [Limnoglobus roseus]
MRSILFLLLCGVVASAQPPSQAIPTKPAPADPKDLPKPQVREPKDGKLTIPITLHPAGVKKPLSRYYLTPQYPEMKPGNRVPTFMRAYMEQDQFFSKEQREKRDRWDQLALEDLPMEEIKACGVIGGLAYRPLDSDQVFKSRGRPLGDVDEGARQLSADWQIWFNIREDGIGTLLPEVQKMRELAYLLKLRMRYEIRTGDIEKAIYTARTFHGLASSFESHPTLIAFLVGLAIESICLEALEELVQQPNCPNLYWSFTEMPARVLDNRTALGGEQVLSSILFKPFLEATGPMTEAELYKQLKVFDSAAGMAGEQTRLKYSLDAPIRSTDKKKVAAARKLLIDTGMKADLVNQFPELQAIITADVRQYEITLDDLLIANSLPFADAIKVSAEVEKKMNAEGSPIAKVLTPALRKITVAHTRIQQRLAYLRALEAIRLYAHEHDGKLPAKLSEISVPLPLDPVTGKAFEYKLADGVATLHGGEPTDEPNGGKNNRYYEIRVKK